MSLVNYSSDEEEEEEEEKQKEDGRQQQQSGFPASSSSLEPCLAHASGSLLATSQVNLSGSVVETSLKLPDASQLFASFDSVKESAVMNVLGGAFNSKKRSDVNGSANVPPKKIPKGSLMPIRITPDTAGGSLLPPQIRGRSNIATEDLDKLFTRKSKMPVEFESRQD